MGSLIVFYFLYDPDFDLLLPLLLLLLFLLFLLFLLLEDLLFLRFLYLLFSLLFAFELELEAALVFVFI